MPATQANSAIEEYTASIAAQFLRLILNECKQTKIDRVFFLTRDATIFKKLLEHLYRTDSRYYRDDGQLKLRDLAISRDITMVLGLPEENSEQWLRCLVMRYITAFGHTVNLADFLSYFACLPADIDKSLNFEHLAGNQWAEFLAHHLPGTRNELTAAVSSRADLLISYLVQRKAVGAGRVAFVDIGYRGTIASRLISHLEQTPTLENLHQNTNIKQLFLISKVAERDSSRRNLPGITALINPADLPAILRVNYSWIECLFRDRSSGRLRGYQNGSDSTIIPVFERYHPDEQDSGPLSVTHIRRIVENSAHQSIHKTADKTVSGFIKHMSYPSYKTVELLNTLRYANENSRYHSNKLSKRLSFSDLTHTGLKRLIAQDYWLSGSLVLSGKNYLIKPINLLLELMYTLKRIKIRRGR